MEDFLLPHTNKYYILLFAQKMVEFSSWESFGRADKQIASSEQKKNLSKRKSSRCFQDDAWTWLSGGIISQNVSVCTFWAVAAESPMRPIPDVWVSLSLSLSG